MRRREGESMNYSRSSRNHLRNLMRRHYESVAGCIRGTSEEEFDLILSFKFQRQKVMIMLLEQGSEERKDAGARVGGKDGVCGHLSPCLLLLTSPYPPSFSPFLHLSFPFFP